MTQSNVASVQICNPLMQSKLLLNLVPFGSHPNY